MSPVRPRRPRPPLRVINGRDGPEAFYPKCSLLLRAGARFFDMAVAWALWVTTGQVGAVIAILYVLLADGMFEGQSAGKRLFGIKVVHLPSRMSAHYRESCLRNAPFGLIVLLAMLPDALGPVAALGGLLVIGGVEGWNVVRDPEGIRLGDVWGQTQVVDGKVTHGALQAPTGQRPAGAEGSMRVAARQGNAPAKVEGGTTCASR